MAIADWIRDATERRRERLRREGYERGYEEGYTDRDAGKPRRRAGSENNQDEPRDNEPGKPS